MFDLFRSRAKAVRYLLGAILLLVALSMVVTLIPGFGTDVRTDQQVVAEVGDEPLSIAEVNQVLQVQIRNRAFPSEMAGIYAPRVINQMVTENVLAYEAERRGFRVTPDDVAQTIENIFPQLYQNGQFVGREAYAAILAQQNMTIPQFEANLRKQLLINKLRGLVLDGVVVTAPQVELAFAIRNEKVKIEYVAITPEKYRAEVNLSPEEIRASFEQNRSSFRVPEKRSVDIVVIDEAQIAPTVTVPEAELRRAYNLQKDSFRTPERVKVRHILLTTTGKPQDEIPKITARAGDLLKQVRQGGNFAELARKNSDDPGSGSKGGELGWIVRGQTVPAFEQTAFTLKPGQISDVITTQYGLHIVQVLEKQDAHVQSFEEVRSQIEGDRKKQMLYERMQNLADQARAALQKDPVAAARVAAELGLQIVKADKLGASDPVPGIGVSRELADAVSSLRKGDVSSVTQVQPTKLAVAAVTELLPARPAELSDVESQIRARLTNEKLKQIVVTRSREVLEKAKSLGGDLKKTAQAMGLDFKTPPEFARAGAAEGLGSASFLFEAFGREVGAVIGPISTGDSQFVCKVVAKIPADMSKFAAERDSIRQQLKSDLAQERVALFEDGLLKHLVSQKKVKIHQDVINRIAAGYSNR